MPRGELRIGVSASRGPYVETALPLPPGSRGSHEASKVYIELLVSPAEPVPPQELQRLREWLQKYAKRHSCRVENSIILRCGCMNAVYEEDTILDVLLGKPPMEEDDSLLRDMSEDMHMLPSQYDYITAVRLSIDADPSCLEKAVGLASGFLAVAKKCMQSYREEAKILVHCRSCVFEPPEELRDSIDSYRIENILVIHLDDVGVLQNARFLEALHRAMGKQSLFDRIKAVLWRKSS